MSSLGNNLMDKFAISAPARLVGMAGHVLFWPIAVSQYALYRLGLFQWYHEVYRSPSGGRILLGGLPWPESTRQKLLTDEHVSAVLNMVSERPMAFPAEKRLDVPLMDFVHPQYKDVVPAVEFIDQCLKEQRTVYVHCRAGKGRSATVVMCWMVSRLGLTPVAAQSLLLRHRPQILNNLDQREVVQQFYTEATEKGEP